MKTLKHIFITLFLCLCSLNALSCETIYLNVIGQEDQVEGKVLEQLHEVLRHQFSNSTIVQSNFYVFPHLENDEVIKANSIIVDLNSETDMTGNDVKVSLYKSDSEGVISFQGSQRQMTNSFFKGKVSALKDLALMGVNFSCGTY